MRTVTNYQESLHRAAFERRRFQRLKRAVQTELRVQGSESPIRAETADISAGGCYIEMGVTLDLGTPLKLVLWLGHKKLQLDAKIVTRHPQFGNGIEFGKMSETSKHLLQAFLDNAEVRSGDCEVRPIPEGLIV
jgi:c-di-GMP-binding flagellar brake protein YcgR